MRKRLSHPTRSTSISIGPRAAILVSNKLFQIAWTESDHIFHDREEKTAQIHMIERSGLDFRHKALLGRIVEGSVRAQLDEILEHYC